MMAGNSAYAVHRGYDLLKAGPDAGKQVIPLLDRAAVTSRLQDACPAVGALAFRPCAPQDDAWLRPIRRAALAGLLPPLPAARLAPLLDMQMRAQDAGYAAAWPGAAPLALLWRGRPAGHLLLGWPAADDGGGPVHAIDMAMAPDLRRQGIGSAAVTALVLAASREGRGVSAVAALSNTGIRRLLDRLGFRMVAEEGPTLRLFRPAGAPPPDTVRTAGSPAPPS